MQYVFILIGIALFFIAWTLIEQKQLVTTKYEVLSKELPKGFDQTRFVVLADLHNYTFGINNERLVKRIEALAPEFIIIAGDMINKRVACCPSNAFTLLEQLAKKYKIYYAYGNHEQRNERLLIEKNSVVTDSKRAVEPSSQLMSDISSTWVEFKDKLHELGVIFLDNQGVELVKKNNRLRITGISIGKEFFKRTNFPDMEKEYLTGLIGEKPKNQYQILIAHNPIYFKAYADWGADLTISGHLHGGMVRIPGIGGVISPQVTLFPKYHGGNFTENGQEMIVSRGLGSHSMMPRYLNTPEVVQITLKCE
jgi:Predicted phosphohydrolases